ncbi:MAG: phage portal protein [Lactobacillaceae bacterium]|jgi:HK97 family phage portal protein|nr:phage portal protein [Lactobacillaceae bacterium]
MSFLNDVMMKLRQPKATQSFYTPWLNSMGGLSLGDQPMQDNAPIFGVISRLANTLSTLPVNLYDDKQDTQNKDYLNNLVSKEPNPYITAYDLWNKAETDRNEHGNSYILIERDEYLQTKYLWNIDPEKITLMQEADTHELYYRVQGVDGFIMVASDSMLHFKHITGASRLRGISPLDVLKGAINYDQAFQQFSLNEMSKRDSFIITYEKNVDPERKRAIAQSIQSFIKANSGVLFNEPGSTVEMIDRKIATADIAENDATFYRRIANVFNVPLVFLNTNDTNTGKTNEEVMTQFVQMTLMPILKQYESEMNKKLLSPMQKKRGFYFRFDEKELLRGNTQARTAMVQQYVRNGVATPNELRINEGFKPIDKPEMNTPWVSGDLYPVDWSPADRKGGTDSPGRPSTDSNEGRLNE